MDEKITNKMSETLISSLSTFNLDKCVGYPRYSIHQECEFVYVAIDPCSIYGDDQRSSRFTVVSMIDPHVYIGADSVEAHNRIDADEVLIKHLKKIRSIKWFQDSKIVLDIESGLGYEPSRIRKLVQDNFDGIICIDILVLGTRQAQIAKNRFDAMQIEFYEHLISDNPHVMKEIQAQFKSFTKTTKEDEIIKCTNHDIVTTMLRALNTRSMFLKDPRYSKYHI